MSKSKTLAQNIIINLHEINEMGLNGECDPLETYIHLKRVEKIFKAVLKGANENATKEAFKEGGTFERHGAEIQCVNGGKMWDFKNCPSWQEIKDELTAKEKELKTSYSAFEQGKNMVSDDGELTEIPNVTYRADSIKIKVLKS